MIIDYSPSIDEDKEQVQLIHQLIIIIIINHRHHYHQSSTSSSYCHHTRRYPFLSSTFSERWKNAAWIRDPATRRATTLSVIFGRDLGHFFPSNKASINFLPIICNAYKHAWLINHCILMRNDVIIQLNYMVTLRFYIINYYQFVNFNQKSIQLYHHFSLITNDYIASKHPIVSEYDWHHN